MLSAAFSINGPCPAASGEFHDPWNRRDVLGKLPINLESLQINIDYVDHLIEKPMFLVSVRLTEYDIAMAPFITSSFNMFHSS